jgi:hypothetical protein
MRKYKIVLECFDEETNEINCTQTIKTKAISEDRLRLIIVEELLRNKNTCWRVSPRPEKFERLFK